VPVDDWKPEHIGIPVLIYNTGDGKRSRGLTLVLAEKVGERAIWWTTPPLLVDSMPPLLVDYTISGRLYHSW